MRHCSPLVLFARGVFVDPIVGFRVETWEAQ